MKSLKSDLFGQSTGRLETSISSHLRKIDQSRHSQNQFTRETVFTAPLEANLSARIADHQQPPPSLLGRFLHFLLVATSGHFVAGTVSSSMLLLSLGLFSHGIGQRAAQVIPLLLTWALLRVALYLVSGPMLPFSSPLIGKRTKSLIQIEVLLFLLLTAGCFLFELTIDRNTLLFFALINITSLVLLNYLSRAGMIWWRRTHTKNGIVQLEKQVIIVGTGNRAKNIADSILSAPELNTSLRGFVDFNRADLWRYRDIPLIGHPDAIRQIISKEQVDAIVIAVDLEELPRTKSLFTAAEEMGVTVYLLPDVYPPQVARGQIGSIDGTPTLVYRSIPEHRASLVTKAIIDRLGALFGLVVASPVMIAAAIAIKLDSPGPIFFRQKRCGKSGRIFEIMKFRTMCIDAEARKKTLAAHNEMSGPVFKMKSDPRITGVGKFLRKYSIDELPQLFNVLLGEMSLVGPRPPLPNEVIDYEPWQHRKLSVRPGLTCIWQVNGRNAISFEDWMRLDLQYIDNWSLWQDAKILVKTIPTVLKGSGV